MNLHHSVDPRLWNFDSELRLLGLGGTPMTRRDVIRFGLLGTASLLGGSALPTRAFAAPAPAEAPAPVRAGRAKSVIQIWLWGGPCHIDTFDPKPDAGYDYNGPLKE